MNIMRFLRRTIIAVLAIPAFLGFQMTMAPAYLCLNTPCDPVDCEMLETTIEACCMEAVAVEPEAGCCMEAVAVEPATGCCGEALVDEEPMNCFPMGSSGCSVPEEMAESMAEYCEAMSGQCFDPEGGCPVIVLGCMVCVPMRFEATPTAEALFRELQFKPDLAVAATLARDASHHRRALLYAHSPPIVPWARNGPQLCIENCAFLI